MRPHQRAGIESGLFQNHNYFGIKGIFLEIRNALNQNFLEKELSQMSVSLEMGPIHMAKTKALP